MADAIPRANKWHVSAAFGTNRRVQNGILFRHSLFRESKSSPKRACAHFGRGDFGIPSVAPRATVPATRIGVGHWNRAATGCSQTAPATRICGQITARSRSRPGREKFSKIQRIAVYARARRNIRRTGFSDEEPDFASHMPVMDREWLLAVTAKLERVARANLPWLQRTRLADRYIIRLDDLPI